LHNLAYTKLEAYKKELIRKEYNITNDSPLFLAYRKQKRISPLLGGAIERLFADASLKAWHELKLNAFLPTILEVSFKQP
jgi:hypothetical protein